MVCTEVARCMHVQANARASRVECAVRGLRLDELEVASLRGEVRVMLTCLTSLVMVSERPPASA